MLSSKTVLLAITCFTLSSCAAPISILRREVPQEKSHQRVLDAVQTSLQKDNVENFIDPVFGLLGNAAAAQGLGTTTDATCLQQAMADRAFTNAKAAGDVDGQVQALIYRALERNSGSVGGVTDPCTSVQAVNPEIAAIQQHQDPASQNADQVNKAIELELAKQIASVGGDPLLALDSATFPPGEIGDATAKGKSCDDANCIFDLNLLTPIATQDEILAAVGGGAGGNAGGNGTNTGANGGANGGAAGNGSNNGNTGGATGNAGNSTNNGNAGGAAGNTGANTGNNGGAADTGAGNAGTSGNLQTFTGALGGTAPAVTPGGRGFQVEGSDDFLNVGAALGRSCDIQHNQCANAANSGGGFSVGDCDQQNNDCRAAAQNGGAANGGAANNGNAGAANGGAANNGNAGAANGSAANTGNTGAADGGAANGGAANTGAANGGAANTGAGAGNNGATGNASGNLQTFTGTLGGSAPAVTPGGRGFQVEGSDDFLNVGAALGRSCDIQHNQCANAANSGGGFSVSDCDQQNNECRAAGSA